MTAPTDIELLARLGTDAAALELFFRRHVDTVTRFVARRCREPEDVADAVAQTFLEVVLSAERFDPRKGVPVAWLLGIAAHCAAAEHRRAARSSATARALAGRELLDEDDYERVRQRIDAERLAPALATALEALSAAERDMFELVDLEGHRPADAARALGLRPAAGRMRLTRARRRLRSALAGADRPGSSIAALHKEAQR